LNVLVDTSVWSLSLRRSRAHLNPVESLAVEELKELIVADRARMMGVVRQEILSGIRNPEQFEKLRVFLRSFVDVPTDTSDFEAAAQMSNQCRGKGITVSIVDALICATASLRGWPIFTTDTDFEHLARVLPIKLHAPRA
jgi:predicted nucleic acid-binding protein